MPCVPMVLPCSTLARCSSGALGSKCAASATSLRMTTSQDGRLFICAIASMRWPCDAGKDLLLHLELFLREKAEILGDVVSEELHALGRQREEGMIALGAHRRGESEKNRDGKDRAFHFTYSLVKRSPWPFEGLVNFEKPLPRHFANSAVKSPS